MVTVQEFNALSPSQQQQTIQDLMSSDPQNAQFLMYYQAEQAGVNIKTPATSTNPTQAAQIKEAQSYNQQVYEESQAAKAESIIVNAPMQLPTSVTPLQALTTVAANTSDRAVLNEAKDAFYPQDKAVADITFNPVDQTLTASYVPKVIAPAPPPAKNDFNIFSAGQNNLFSNVLTGIQDPFSIGKKSFLTNVADYKGDSTQFFVKQSIKIGGLVSLGVAPAVAVGGALVSTGLSQGIKALQGEGALTSKEVQDAFYGGAAFSVVGGATVKALGLTGSGVKQVAGRVGVNALLGAGAGGVYEYAETKQVTLEGLGTGAAFGAGFGLAGEAFSVGRVKASQKLQDNLMGSLNKAVESNTVWKPSASDKATMLLLRKVPNIQQNAQKVSQIKFVNEPSGLAAGKFKELDYIKTINREIAPTKVNSDTVFESSSTIKPGLFRELDYTRSIDRELFQDWRKTVKPYYENDAANIVSTKSVLPTNLNKIVDSAVTKYGINKPRIEMYESSIPELTAYSNSDTNIIKLPVNTSKSLQENMLAHELGHLVEAKYIKSNPAFLDQNFPIKIPSNKLIKKSLKSNADIATWISENRANDIAKTLNISFKSKILQGKRAKKALKTYESSPIDDTLFNERLVTVFDNEVIRVPNKKSSVKVKSVQLFVGESKRDYFIGSGKSNASVKGVTDVLQPELLKQTQVKVKPYKTFDVEGERQVNDLLNRGLFREAELVSANRLGIELDTKALQQKGFNPSRQGGAAKSVKRLTGSGRSGVVVPYSSAKIGSKSGSGVNGLVDTGSRRVTMPSLDVVSNTKSDPKPVGIGSFKPVNRVVNTPSNAPNSITVFKDNVVPIFQTDTVNLFRTQPKTQRKTPYSIPSFKLGGGGGRRGGGGSWGRWYYRKHPIPSASQQIKQLSGGKIQKVKLRKTKSKRKRGSKR